MLKYTTLTLVCIIAAFNLNAQFTLNQVSQIPVYHGSRQLANPWTGGLNSPELSEIDLNGDGVQDLFIFDKDGSAILTFINYGTPGVIDYRYAPKYQDDFPSWHWLTLPRVWRWALLRDYNCDGLNDLWCHANAGVQLFEARRFNADSIYFLQVDSPLTYHAFPYDNNIYVANEDLPGIVDMDFDGDMDLLSFSSFGATIDYHQNMSMEMTGRCDSLVFIKATTCWGHFAEKFLNNGIDLGACKTDETPIEGSGGARHAGSTICTPDADLDGDIDLILGDISFPNLVYLENGGDSSWADVIWYDSLWPSYDYSANIPIYPAGYTIDANNDGLVDVVGTPHSLNAAMNHGNLWYYENKHTVVGDSDYEFQTDSFLISDMIDVGEYSYPMFLDYNGDSLTDLLIGNHGYFVPSGSGDSYASGVALYENIGDKDYPKFKLVTKDFANLSALPLSYLYMAFGDMDNDGDEDMILGEEDGLLHYFVNGPSGFTLAIPNLADIDVGQFSAPALNDMDDDGDLDLVVGNKAGKLHYYPNTGSASAFVFSDTSVNTNLGNINVTSIYMVDGRSTPHVTYFDSSGTKYLMVGSRQGYIYTYAVNTDSLMEGSFAFADSSFGYLDIGEASSVAVTDLNNDMKYDLALGNVRGGVSLYSQGKIDTVVKLPSIGEALLADDGFQIYPNPTTGAITIKIGDGVDGLPENIAIYNVIGAEVLSTAWLTNARTATLELPSRLNNGIYFIQLTYGNKDYIEKLLLQR